MTRLKEDLAKGRSEKRMIRLKEDLAKRGSGQRKVREKVDQIVMMGK